MGCSEKASDGNARRKAEKFGLVGKEGSSEGEEGVKDEVDVISERLVGRKSNQACASGSMVVEDPGCAMTLPGAGALGFGCYPGTWQLGLILSINLGSVSACDKPWYHSPEQP